jgi:protein tyrosine phosphatase (PTP) superfamily phosphohydrolase (DUF442 family)
MTIPLPEVSMHDSSSARDPRNPSPSPAALASVAAELMNGACPLPDVASAGQPRAEHFRRLAEAGYRTVIDLRAPDEPRGFDEPAAAREAGLVYENIPVTAQSLGDGQFDRLRALLNDPAMRPAVVHCGSANRVGALLIPYLLLDEGRTPDESLATARQVGLRSPELAELALRYAKAHGAAGL